MHNIDFSSLTSLNNIRSRAFYNSGVISVVFNSNIQQIDSSAFQNCEFLKTLDLSNAHNLRSTSENCYSNCFNLTSVKFSSEITEIGSNSFGYCTSLSHITLPQSITTIQQLAFIGCSRLTNIELPLNCNLAHIYGQAFAECSMLTDIILKEGESNFKFEEGVLMDSNETQIIIFLPASPIEFYVVPAHVQTIGEFAFSSCTKLRSVIIPNGNINTIGQYAFSGCTRLSFLYLPKSLANVQSNAFESCSSLRCGSIMYPDDLYDKLVSSGIEKSALGPGCSVFKLPTCLHNKSRLFNPQYLTFIMCLIA